VIGGRITKTKKFKKDFPVGMGYTFEMRTDAKGRRDVLHFLNMKNKGKAPERKTDIKMRTTG
jgi:hypothetical protein